ncbi:MAG: hypothetical protein AAB289_16670, partial [Chloroflexota bacterium]
ADSLGVRSMATMVTGGGVSLLIDPGAALGGLERNDAVPSDAERQAAAAARARIITAASRCDAVFVTSYGPDHHNLLADCRATLPVFLKTPSDAGEYSAARAIIDVIKGPGRSIGFAGGSETAFGALTVGCSAGLSAMAVTVRSEGRTFVHGSSSLNRDCDAGLRHVIGQAPDLVYLSGAPLYRLGEDNRDSDGEPPIRGACRKALRALLELVGRSGCRAVVDHELLRTMDYRQLYAPAFATGRVSTAAEFLNSKETLLEAARMSERGALAARGGQVTAAA